MKIEHEFTVPAPLDEVWPVLTDIPTIVPCMPGAQLVGVDTGAAEDGGDAYQGKVKVKIGPVTAEYKGVAQFLSRDDDAHQAVIDARGRDSRGAGQAAAVITMSLAPDEAGTKVTVDTDLKISGKIAQLGGGMIREVSEKLLGQFVDRLKTQTTAQPEPEVDQSSDAGPAPVNGSVAPDPLLDEEPVIDEPGNVTFEAVPAGSVSEGSVVRETPAVAADATATAVATPAPTGLRPVRLVPAPTEDVEAVDLLQLAGGAASKRLIPLVVGLVAAVVAVIIFRSRR